VTRRCAVPLAAALSAALTAGFSTALAAGLQSDVVFREYSPLSSTPELVRRLSSPLTALRLTQEAERAGKVLRGQPIDLTRERFSLYVPAGAPPAHGYSLLVFVPPWPKAEVPRPWMSVLDRHAMIFVTAANSGNDANTADRREPLALLAATNVMTLLPVDPQQVYVGGFSGGSRVALRLALGYPDLFQGALLNAGSDPIGTAELPLPPGDLFRQVQDSTRLVYVTGERDDAHLVDDMHSRQSLEKLCIFDVVTVTEPRREHEVADLAAFSRSLDALLGHGDARRSSRLAECRAGLERDLDVQLSQAEQAFTRGESSAARALLSKIDVRFSGLAAPRSVELARRL